MVSREGGRSFTVSTIQFWNSLPAELSRTFFKDLYQDLDSYESLLYILKICRTILSFYFILLF
jgi:hypothetical protein